MQESVETNKNKSIEIIKSKGSAIKLALPFLFAHPIVPTGSPEALSERPTLKDFTLLGRRAIESEVSKKLISIIEQGRICPLIAEAFDLEDICYAQAMFMGKKYVGKIVLSI